MVLLARHRYMIVRIAEAFDLPEDEIEQMIQFVDVINPIDYFFTADGPTKIIVTLEQVEAVNPDKVPQSSKVAKLAAAAAASASDAPDKVLKVHSKSLDYLPSSAVYFLKPKRGKDNEDHYAIDPAKVNDGCLTFGIIRSPLESLEAVLRCVYKPMVTEMGAETWGEATIEQKTEFLGSLELFSRGLQDSIRSLSGGLELGKPDPRVETLGSAGAGDPVLVNKCLKLLHEWCTNIEHYLDDSDRNRWETIDSGPDTELNYWRSRMQR